MTLSERLSEYISAAFTGLWVQSFEHEDALAEIGRLCRQHNWPLATWDIDRGLQVAGQATGEASDPVAAIKSINALASPEGTALLVLPNFHRFLQSGEVSGRCLDSDQTGIYQRTDSSRAAGMNTRRHVKRQPTLN